MYIVIRAFKDSMDNDRFYREGDVYPASGKASKKRIEELLKGTNRNGKMYIQEVATEDADSEASADEGADENNEN